MVPKKKVESKVNEWENIDMDKKEESNDVFVSQADNKPLSETRSESRDFKGGYDRKDNYRNDRSGSYGDRRDNFDVSKSGYRNDRGDYYGRRDDEGRGGYRNNRSDSYDNRRSNFDKRDDYGRRDNFDNGRSGYRDTRRDNFRTDRREDYERIGGFHDERRDNYGRRDDERRSYFRDDRRGDNGSRFDRRNDDFNDRQQSSRDYRRDDRYGRRESNPPSEGLIVFGLPQSMSHNDFEDFVRDSLSTSQFTYQVKVVQDRNTGECKGFGFVTLQTVEEAVETKRIIEEIGSYKGSSLRLDFSRNDNRRR
ncbi:hypothetical protein HERIO_72 [Hepatospora eriocheir]|uniref:RRM domain-containing protein n=1 Tax=Hepatospora eriocheir TaxID=1081669 RepID=A0A1X0QE42_9MICR|nr:hypothetical protein HERIO_72 [Hepatospora eriocheir]